MSGPPVAPGASRATTPSLVVDGVTMALPNRTVGPIVATLGTGLVHLTGANGSGKTTLLRVLCAEVAPTSGVVRLDGVDPTRSGATRARISYLPAVPELPNFLTVRESWAMFAALRGRPAWSGAALAEQLGVDPGRRLDQLSVGQRRKAELIAAVAGDPDVLLLDEVFAPLDAASVEVVAAMLHGWRARRILILTGHGGMPVAADETLAL